MVASAEAKGFNPQEAVATWAQDARDLTATLFDVAIRHCRQRAAQLLARALVAVLKALKCAPVLGVEKRRRGAPVRQ